MPCDLVEEEAEGLAHMPRGNAIRLTRRLGKGSAMSL